MVATTFAADTPLVVTGLVARNGIAGNWLWWNMVASGMLTVFLFSRFWRRSGMTTDIELAELRYSGKPAAFLRGFRSVYLGVVMNCIILGWVNLPMVKILMLVLGISKDEALWIVIGIIALTSFVSTLSGLWGVLVTDLFQFAIKMTMVIVLGVQAVRAVGGVAAMKSQAGRRGQRLPELRAGSPFAGCRPITFFVYIAVNWWATWYPGAEPGGGGYIAQRMFSAKDERNSLLATLWFNIAHYALRPWPWVVVGDGFGDSVSAPARSRDRLHPRHDRLPAGVSARSDGRRLRRRVHVHDRHATQLGRQLSGQRFLPPVSQERRTGTPLRARFADRHDSADRHLGGDHALHGFDRRRMEAADRHRRRHGQRAHSALVLVAHQRMERSLRHGRGVCCFDGPADRVSSGQRRPVQFAHIILITVGITTVVWLATTFLTAPETNATLLGFYRRVRPLGRLGTRGPLAPEVRVSKDLGWNLLDWLCGCVLIYGALFGIGRIILEDYGSGVAFLGIAAAGWRRDSIGTCPAAAGLRSWSSMIMES